MTRNQVLSTLRERMWRKRFAGGGEPPLPWATFSGNPLQFTAPKAHTLRSTTVEFAPKQDLHGYDNPWPAGGGKNKLVFTIANLKSVNTNGTWSGNTYTINGVSYAVSVDDAGNTTGIVASNTATANAVIDVGRNETILPAGTYYIPSNNSTTNVNYIVFKVVGETATSLGGVNSFTLTEETSIFIRYVVSSGNTPSGTIKPMLCTTSTSEPFSPYSNICPISGWTSLDVFDEPDYDPTAQPMTTLTFPSTVYGGTASVAEDGTATGSDEWATITFDGTQDGLVANWRPNADSVGWYYNFTGMNMETPASTTVKTRAICDSLLAKTYDSMWSSTGNEFSILYTAGYRRIVIRTTDTSLTTKDAVNAYLAEHPITIAYPLATPAPFAVTASSTPTAVVGINTMWTDGDTLTVEARAEAVNLNALQSLNMLLGGRYYNNGTADEPTDEEALDILLGGNTK